MTEPDDVVPPDDTGSDTFARFEYQAHVTFPYCFELARDHAITNVFAEHIEDIAVEAGSSWRFLQVKTRNAGRGPWTLAEVMGSGAIDSLWRAHKAVGPALDATYELQLEGALRNGDPLADIASGASPDDAVRTRLAVYIGVEVADVDLFASRLRVRGLPLRGSIIASNLRLLGTEAPLLSVAEIERTYEAALVAIKAAMTADRLNDRWPAALFVAPEEQSRLRLESKRIDRKSAQRIFAPILRAATFEDASSVVSATPSRTAPFILPQLDVPTFTGRSEELERLEAALLREEGEKVGSIAGVSGSGGIGKSALACHFAELHRNAFPDGVIGLRVDGKEPIGIAREFARCAFAEVDPDDARDASTIMQEVFRGQRALLLFDNAEDVSIRSLLPGGARCAVIITTRDRGLPVALGIPDGARLDLSPLPADEAIALLERLVGTRVSLDRDAATRICKLVGNLPLAIQIVGATLQIQTWRSMADYENALREEKERLSVLRVRGDSELDVHASFSLSLRLLEPAEIDFFACLAVCAQDGFSIVGAAAANGCDERTAQELLAHLFRLSLVNRSAIGANRFVLHPLLRLFARELANDRDVRVVAEKRHREFFAGLVKTRNIADPEVVALLGREVDDIVAAAESMQRSDFLDYEFVIRLEPFFQRHGYWEKAASIFAAFLHSAERANDWAAVVQLQLQQAKFLTLRGNLGEAESLLMPLKEVVARVEPESARRRATAMWLNTFGGVLQRLGRFDEAVSTLQKSAALEEEAQNRGGSAKVLNSLGSVLQRKGDFKKAAEMFRLSAAIDQELGNPRGEAMTLNSLGGVLQKQGDFETAIKVLRRSEDLLTAIGDLRGEAMVLNSLGGVLQRQGDFVGAANALRRSAFIEARLHNERGEAMVLNSLGGVLQRQGDFAGAANALRRSASIEARLDNERGEAMVLNSLGGVLQRQGKFDEAVDAFRRSYAISEGLLDQRSVAMVLNSLGGVLQRQGKFDEAVDAFRRSAAIGEDLGDQRHLAMALNSLGGVLQRQGKFDEAVDAFRRSASIDARLGNQRGEAMVLNSLGGVLQRQGKFDEAVDAFRKSYAISENLHDDRSVAMVLNSLGGVLQRQGKFDEAVDAFRRSHAISEKSDDQRSLAMVLNSLGGVLQRQGKFDEAVDAFRSSYTISEELHDQRGQAMVLNSLGGVLQRQRKFTEADDAFRESVAIGEKLGDQRHLAMVHTAFGRALLNREPEVAVRELSAGFELDAALRNRKGVGIVAPVLVDTLFKLGRIVEARSICERALEIAPADVRLLQIKHRLDV